MSASDFRELWAVLSASSRAAISQLEIVGLMDDLHKRYPAMECIPTMFYLTYRSCSMRVFIEFAKLFGSPTNIVANGADFRALGEELSKLLTDEESDFETLKMSVFACMMDIIVTLPSKVEGPIAAALGILDAIKNDGTKEAVVWLAQARFNAMF